MERFLRQPLRSSCMRLQPLERILAVSVLLLLRDDQAGGLAPPELVEKSLVVGGHCARDDARAPDPAGMFLLLAMAPDAVDQCLQDITSEPR